MRAFERCTERVVCLNLKRYSWTWTSIYIYIYNELINAAQDAAAWIEGVREIGDGWNDGTLERLQRALRKIRPQFR